MEDYKMKYFKKLTILAFCIFLAVNISVFGQESDPITLKLGHATQTAHPYHLAAAKFAELVSSKSGGRLEIKIYPARMLGDDTELAEQVMSGTIDMGVIAGSIFSKYTPLLDTMQLPFLLNSYDKEFKAMKTDEMEEILTGLEPLGLKGLGIFEGGMRYIANNVRPINNPDDLKGLKLRVAPSNLLLDNLEALGANPTPMAYGEVYSGLQTSVIDGEEINLTSIYVEKHYEVLKYVSLMPLFPFPGLCAINLQTFNNLSIEDQRIIEEATNETLNYIETQLKDIDAKSLQKIKEMGVNVNEVNDLEPFIERTEDIYFEYTNKDPRIKKFVEMAKDL